MIYYVTKTVKCRADTEKEAQELINNAKQSKTSVLTKYTSTKVEKKKKGEIVDEYYRVTLTQQLDNEADPQFPITLEDKDENSEKEQSENNFDFE